MSRYQQLFSKLAKSNKGAFVPFITLGDPNLEQSEKIIDTLIAAGADALELGIPFSDPLADGPTIQNANLRAFSANITPEKCFALLARVRQKHPNIPMGLLMYANLVFKPGIDNFYARCAEVGVDSVLVADVPIEESLPFCTAAKKYNINPIFICPPDATDETIKKVAEHGQGYTYLVSRTGVTGAENNTVLPLAEVISRLNQYNAPPVLQGFGISKPEHVKSAINSGSKGAISGSAIINIIEKNLNNTEVMLEQLSQFVKRMKEAA